MARFSPKLFTEFPLFKPTMDISLMLNRGICGGTLFFTHRARKGLTEKQLKSGEVTTNMEDIYSEERNMHNVRIPKKWPNGITIHNPQYGPWALWYYKFWNGLRTHQDEVRIAQHRDIVKSLFRYLRFQATNENQVFDKTFLPEISQALLEHGWDRAVEPETYEIKGTLYDYGSG